MLGNFIISVNPQAKKAKIETTASDSDKFEDLIIPYKGSTKEKLLLDNLPASTLGSLVSYNDESNDRGIQGLFKVVDLDEYAADDDEYEENMKKEIHKALLKYASIGELLSHGLHYRMHYIMEFLSYYMHKDCPRMDELLLTFEAWQGICWFTIYASVAFDWCRDVQIAAKKKGRRRKRIKKKEIFSKKKKRGFLYIISSPPPSTPCREDIIFKLKTLRAHFRHS
ncbi:hypothetical protein IEQ34_021207 [Dendrobium chrysotoxum]|uniref:Uncharacterized protein n=1 Tax=Dendrobium chrysotoxum TaxID=161865 RepID=A0AAV7G444_DENCH|nr:hypothetical protein IEQ34_021207 [Dendrobium chrysotoxum]